MIYCMKEKTWRNIFKLDISLLSNFSMLMLVIGTLPSIYSAWKSRENLGAFSLIGALSLVIGQMGFLIMFALIGDYITSTLSAITTLFWWIVLIYKLKMRNKY